MKVPSSSQVQELHDRLINEYGGSLGLRDEQALESACARPKAGFGEHEKYSTLWEKSAALIHGIIKNHPFVDGNKRTGIASGLSMLRTNDVRIDVEQKELVNVTLKIAQDEWNIDDLAEWLKNNSIP